MNKDFDFNEVGKRMPYTVPEGFFDKMEENIMTAVRNEKPQRARRARIIKMAWGGALAIAASLALFVTLQKPTIDEPSTIQTAELTNNEFDYSSLSTEDQEYLKEVYENDIFINNDLNSVEL